MFFVYILQSTRNGRFYVGQTDNLITRFSQHQQSLCRSTKAGCPWVMPFYEVYATRRAAIIRERQIKRMKSAESIARIIKAGYRER